MASVDVPHADEVRIETGPDHSVGYLVRKHLEPSRLGGAYGFAGLDPLYFETSVVPHFSILPQHFRVALFLTPKIVLRMFREASAPVKTPSYMPSLTAVFWFRDEPDAVTPYFFATLEHHSNGQSGPFRVDGRVNHDAGSFETNDADLGVCIARPESTAFNHGCLDVEYHPPFAENAELRGTYGNTRIHWAATVFSSTNPLNSQLSARLGAIFGSMAEPTDGHALLARFPVFVEYSVHPAALGVGFYVSYYQGQDYYNIWYDRFVSVTELGIVGNLTTGVE